MNKLQITLIVLGLVFIGLVLLYNWWQDREAQKRLNRHFDQSSADPLLDGQAGMGRPSGSQPVTVRSYTEAEAEPEHDEPRLGGVDYEPMGDGPSFSSVDASAVEAPAQPLQPAADEVTASERPAAVAPAYADEPGPDSMTEAVVDLRFERPVMGQALIEQTMRYPTADDKPIRYFAETEAGGYHAVIRPDVMYVALQMAVLLSNRTGPLQDVHWSAAMMIADNMAHEFDADVEAPSFKSIEGHALDLDDLCASLDAQVGLTLLLDGPQSIKSVAEIARKRGFVEYRQTLAWLNNQGQACFYMLFDGLALNFVESASVERVELLLDVPNSPADPHAFGKMVGAARDLAGLLRASIVDDQNQPLEHDELVATVDEQIYEIYQRLDQVGLTAASERARRVFA